MLARQGMQSAAPVGGWAACSSKPSFLTIYFALLSVLCVYGFHRYYMAWLYFRHKNNVPQPKSEFTELPRVTIQLPLFNEQYVVERLIDSVARIRYPRDRFEIQVLDDSTDETRQTMASRRGWSVLAAAQGYRHRLHSPCRPLRLQGRGAGQAGLHVHTSAEYVAIFDADFIPDPEIPAASTIHYFSDPQVASV